jgi:hypothetical protein
MPQAPTIEDVVRNCCRPSWRELGAALALLVLLQITPAAAQTAADGQAGTGKAFTASDAAEIKSLKEKLSDKASDEQRVDNCRVPPDRRGTTPRPDCSAERAAASAPAGSAR